MRRFHEARAHKERRMLREAIAIALEEEGVDVSGLLGGEDERLFPTLRAMLEARRLRALSQHRP
ncbi:MAG: hypothetical protein C4290_06510, partial [Chloroflexota bacterium]